MPKKRETKGGDSFEWPTQWENLSLHLETSIEVGLITEIEAGWIADIANDLINLFAHARYDPNSIAAEQIRVIHKLLKPQMYEMPAAVIKELARKYQGVPAHNRAIAVRKIMWRISHALEPARPDAQNMLDGPVNVRPLDKVDVWPREEAEAVYAEVKEHWKPNVTLQSLAIRIYLAEIKKAEVDEADVKKIDDASLRADLRALAAWERENTPHFGAAAEPTAPLWRLLASRQVPPEWKKLPQQTEDEEGR